MANIKVSDPTRVGGAYWDAPQKLETYISRMHEDHDTCMHDNPYYETTSAGRITGLIFLEIAVAFVAFVAVILLSKGPVQVLIDFDLRTGSTMEEVAVFFGRNDIDALATLMAWCAIAAFILCTVRLVVAFYCISLGRYSSKIDRAEKKARIALEDMQKAGLMDKLVAAVGKNEDCVVETNNSLGKLIGEIRVELAQINQRACFVNKWTNIIASLALYVILFLYMALFMHGNMRNSITCGVTLAAVCIIAAAAVNFMQLSLADHMGKFAKAIGCIMSLIYGMVLYLCIRGTYTLPMMGENGNPYHSVFATSASVISIMQTAVIILTVFMSDYKEERTNWKNGFSVISDFEIEKNGSKAQVVFRGIVATIVTFILCVIWAESTKASDVPSVMWIIAMFGSVFWYCANSFMKPTGSYLVAFWDDWKCTAHEFVIGVMLVSVSVGTNGFIIKKTIAPFIVMIIVSFIVGAIWEAIWEEIEISR